MSNTHISQNQINTETNAKSRLPTAEQENPLFRVPSRRRLVIETF